MEKKYARVLMTLLVLSFTTTLFAQTAKELKSFRKGYQEGTQALREQFDVQGWRQKKVIFKNYIVALPTKNLAINDIAYICNASRKNGYTPIVTKSLIVFGDYDRAADAEYNSAYINKQMKIKTYGQNVKGKHFYTYPLFKNIYKRMESDIIEKNNVLVVTQYSHKIKFVKQKCKKQKIKGRKVIYFRINKNIAQGYEYEDMSKIKKGGWREKNFNPIRVFKDNDQLYKKGKVITTKNGKKYIKVYNKNLFFDASKVKVMAIYI